LLAQVDEQSLARLAQDPHDDRAILNRARVLIATGEFDQALECLAADPARLKKDQFGSLFFESLTLGLRADPTGYDRFVQLAVTAAPGQDTSGVRAVRLAEQLAESEQTDAARTVLRALLESADRLQALVPVSASRSVRLDRRIAAGLRRLDGTPGNRTGDAPAEAGPPDNSAAGELQAFVDNAKIEARAKVFDAKSPNPKALQFLPVVVESCRGPVADLLVTYEIGKRTLVGQDRWGRGQFQIELPEANRRTGRTYLTPQNPYQHAALAGNVLVYHRGDIVVAVDLSAAPPRLLWTADAWPPDQDLQAEYGLLLQQRLALGFRLPNARNVAEGGVFSDRVFPRQVGATKDGVCFQRGREIVVVEPRSGEEYWVRDDFPVGMDLMCGTDHVLVTPLSNLPSVLLSALDGKRIAERPTLPVAERIAIHQGRALLFDPGAAPPEMSLYDPVEDRAVWRRALPQRAVPAVGAGGTVGVADGEGNLSLMDLATGEEIASATIGSLPNLNKAAILQYGDVTVFALNQTRDEKEPLWRTNPPAGEINLSGKLAALNSSSGQVLWTKTLEDQRLRIVQPSGLPLLVAYNYFRKLKRSNNKMSYDLPQVNVDCVDVRSGEIVKRIRRGGIVGYQYYRLGFDAQTKTAVLDSRTDSVELRFVSR
jgi:hypothetical protein